MQHLVIHDVLQRAPRYPRMIEHPAHHNRVMRGIVVPQAIAGMIAAPRHLRTRQQAVEETYVQIVKDRFKIVESALRRLYALAPAHLPQQMCFLADVVARNISSIVRESARAAAVRDSFPEKLGGDALSRCRYISIAAWRRKYMERYDKMCPTTTGLTLIAYGFSFLLCLNASSCSASSWR